MPRKATGTIARAGDHWKARIRLAAGSGPWVDLPSGLSEAKAREMAAALTERARSKNWKTPPKNGALPPPGSTVAEWSKRWLAHRAQRGLTSVRDDKGRLEHHILPLLGDLAVPAVTRADIERVVADLDSKVRAKEMTWKTAWNIWAVLRRMFRD